MYFTSVGKNAYLIYVKLYFSIYRLLALLRVGNNEMEGSVFTPALEGIKLVKSEQGEILTQPFLDACKHILPVIGTCSYFP